MDLTTLRNVAERLDADEAGDLPVGPVLLIGLIVIPLTIFLIKFGAEVQSWFNDNWKTLRDGKGGISGTGSAGTTG